MSAAAPSFPADQYTNGYHPVFTNLIPFESDDLEHFDANPNKHEYQEDDESEKQAVTAAPALKPLGALASGKQKIKEQMFAQIVLFRSNRKNGTQKLTKLKQVFQDTFLKLTCTDEGDVSTWKKKCGRLWACIEYAEFVDTSSFACSHVERMQTRHNAYLLSRMGDGGKFQNVSEVENMALLTPNLLLFPVESEKFQNVSEVDNMPLLIFPVDAQAPLAPSRKTIRKKIIPDRNFDQEKGKKQNDVKIVNVDSCLTSLRAKKKKKKKKTYINEQRDQKRETISSYVSI